MRPDLHLALQAIARVNDGKQIAVADTPELVQACEELFDRGYLTILPPGHRYRLSAEGRALVASAAAAVPAYRQRARAAA